jgi:hypothetical protein
MTPSAGLREPLGGGRAPSAGPNAAQRRGPQGWAGYTQDGWPQATDQTPSAKRLTIATVPQQPQGSQLAARRARMRPASADGCATVPSEGTLHRVGFVNPSGREAVGDTKRRFSAATGAHYMQWGITLKRSVWPQRACATTATNHRTAGRAVGYGWSSTRRKRADAISAIQRTKLHLRSTGDIHPGLCA